MRCLTCSCKLRPHGRSCKYHHLHNYEHMDITSGSDATFWQSFVRVIYLFEYSSWEYYKKNSYIAGNEHWASTSMFKQCFSFFLLSFLFFCYIESECMRHGSVRSCVAKTQNKTNKYAAMICLGTFRFAYFHWLILCSLAMQSSANGQSVRRLRTTYASQTWAALKK